MADFTYLACKKLAGNGGLDWANDTIKVLICMTNTDADEESQKDDADFLTDLTLDEYDGANYARKTLASLAWTKDGANDRYEGDAADVTWSSLGVGTRQAQAMIVYLHGTGDSDSIPLRYIDTGGFPFDGNGGDVTVTWNAQGILQAT